MQSLVLHVSDSFFINPLGPGVVWTPAVPGRLQDCEARGEAMSTSAYFATCVRKAEKHGFEVESISTNIPDTGRPDPASLLASVVAVPVDDIPIDVGSGGSTSKAAMAHLHVHVPPEAIDIAVILKEVCGETCSLLWCSCGMPSFPPLQLCSAMLVAISAWISSLHQPPALWCAGSGQ